VARILLWHGWLLQGTGSNVFTAEVAAALRQDGHDVVVLCQETRPENLGFIDAWGSVDESGVSSLSRRSAPEGGRCIVLRPTIGSLLPVFVLDDYIGFRAVRFVDLQDDELNSYLERSIAALRAAAEWHRPEFVIVGHAMPGPVVARRALGSGRYVAIVHGSDLEYAVGRQARYRDLAIEGLAEAAAVVGLSEDILRRTIAIVPQIRGRTRTIHPGVDADRFHPETKTAALDETAAALEADTGSVRGRPEGIDLEVRKALSARDASRFETLARSYDQTVPDPDASIRLGALSARAGPLIGYFGKLIPQKGVHLLIQALPQMRNATEAVIVGFGLYREWLSALVQAIDAGDAAALKWLGEAGGMELRSGPDTTLSPNLQRRITFTGRLDHRYAPGVLAALDVLVVPSLADEAFGLVAAEGAAAGALPLVARHSGLAEVADALESAVGRPGLFSYDPAGDVIRNIADGVGSLLAIDAHERSLLRRALADFVGSQWTWKRAAAELLVASRVERRSGTLPEVTCHGTGPWKRGPGTGEPIGGHSAPAGSFLT
jgi:glycosyltransferase involved in cell wall biosynthesis